MSLTEGSWAQLQDAACLALLSHRAGPIVWATYHTINRLREEPGTTTQALIAERLALPKQRVNEAIRRLLDWGLIDEDEAGYKCVKLPPESLRRAPVKSRSSVTRVTPDRDADSVTPDRDASHAAPLPESRSNVTCEVTLDRDAESRSSVTRTSYRRQESNTPPPVGEAPARHTHAGEAPEEEEGQKRATADEVSRARHLVESHQLDPEPWVRFRSLPPAAVRAGLEQAGFGYTRDAHGPGGTWECAEPRRRGLCRRTLVKLLGELDEAPAPAPAAVPVDVVGYHLPDAAPHLAELWDRVDGELAARFGPLHTTHFAGLYPVSRDGDALVVAHPDEMSALLVVGYLPALSEVVSAAAGESIEVQVWKLGDTAAEGAARRAS